MAASTDRRLWWSLFVAVCSCAVSLANGNCDYATPQEGQFLLCADDITTVEVGQNTSLRLYVMGSEQDNETLNLVLNVTVDHSGIIDVPDQVEISSSNATILPIHGIGAGRTLIGFIYAHNDGNISNSSGPIVSLEKVKFEASIVHWLPLNIIIAVVGWIYFAAWSISFYPQIILNFQRRSVVGLNFDFLAYNITGFLCYSVFNIGLYWIPVVQQEYFDNHPGGVNPVQINDVIFALHATLVTAFTIFQCLIFERGGQRMSYIGMILLSLMWLTIVITLFVAVGSKLSWLNFLYVLSYIKLAVTLVKYVPQAWMNCRRRSTVGWSIGNVLLDFTGGMFSILQMFLLSYNYDDWKSIFGDPTKFGLGFFSVCFDLLFMLQHYVLFRKPRQKKSGYEKIGGSDNNDPREYNEKTKLIDDDKQNDPHKNKLKQLLVILHLA